MLQSFLSLILIYGNLHHVPCYHALDDALLTLIGSCGWVTGESDITERPIDPIKVYTEKELAREIEKIASTLVPEKDWSIRIAAMQRIEGLVFGGFANSVPLFLCLCMQIKIS